MLFCADAGWCASAPLLQSYDTAYAKMFPSALKAPQGIGAAQRAIA